MPEHEHSHEIDGRMGGVVARGAFGGALMGLANLVPGISGGTMLLAAGIFRAVITALAEVTTLKFRVRSLVLLASVAAAGGVAILLGAGLLKSLVLEHRWIMYSLFIGLTFGGVPMVWGLIRDARAVRARATWIGFAIGFAALAVMAFTKGASASGGSNMGLLLVAGAAGASAMVLPGVSGAYLLLVLGQYVPILSAVDRVKEALKGGDIGAAVAEWPVVVPVGLGVAVGLVGVSNLLKWMLHRHEALTLGLLLGLLIGSVLGLYPFVDSVSPAVGDVFKGQAVTAETLAGLEADREDWPLQAFRPSAVQVASSLGLMVLGFLITGGVARLGALSPEGKSESGVA
ncbi:MAG: DUF368 domain-containing protein [Phycisphaerales bacterium]|nr:DUF368 domain-containing protein [Phycisphaerales bacterium]